MSAAEIVPPPLSDAEIRQIVADVGAGRQRRVWFTSAAVGVGKVRSGTVLEVGDRAEPDFLRIKPAGSSDVLSFSPLEVTLIEPARRRSTRTAKWRSPKPDPATQNTLW